MWIRLSRKCSSHACASARDASEGALRVRGELRVHGELQVRGELRVHRVSRQVCLKSAKNLYFKYRFFDKIRQFHSFFYVFRQNLQIL